jgi:hypothetical protein
MVYEILLSRVLPFCTGFILSLSLTSAFGVFSAVGEIQEVPAVKDVPYYSGKYRCGDRSKTKSYHKKKIYKRYHNDGISGSASATAAGDR